MRKLINLIIFIFFALLAITIYLSNQDPVTVRYYFDLELTLPLALVLIVTFVVGVFIGALVASISVYKSKRQASKAKKQLAKAEKQMELLSSASSDS